MRRLANIPFSGTAAALLAAAAIAVWLAFTSFYDIDVFLPWNNTVYGPIRPGHQVVQTFVAPNNGLARIDLPMLPAKTAGSLDVELDEVTGSSASQPPETTAAVRRFSADGLTLERWEANRFEFTPIPDSAGKTYAIRVSEEQGGPQGPELEGGTQDIYSGGRLFVDGVTPATDLAFSVFHTTGVISLLSKIEPFRPLFFGAPAFYLLLLIAGAALFGWLLWQLAAGGAEAVGACNDEAAATARTAADTPGPAGAAAAGANFDIAPDSGAKVDIAPESGARVDIAPESES